MAVSPKRESMPNPKRASDLNLQFQNYVNTSNLVFEHLNFENHGDGAEDYKIMMDGSQGWDYILSRYQQYCSKN